jgi:hypothetical protein
MGVRSLRARLWDSRKSPCGQFHEYVMDSLTGGATMGVRSLPEPDFGIPMNTFWIL